MSPARSLSDPEVPPDGEMRFWTTLLTRWSDVDLQGVLNNAAYPTLLEEARHAYFHALALLDGAAFPFVLRQTSLRFVRPGRGRAEVEVAVRTTGLGRSSLSQAYRVRERAGGEVWCEAEAVLVLVDPESGAPRAMDSRFRAAVGELEGLEE